MRIAMIGQQGIPAAHGGVERAVEELSAELVERGHEVTVFNRREYRGEPVRLHRGIRLVPVPATDGKYSANLTQSLSSVLWALRHRFDVVHFHAMGPCLWAPLARFGTRAAIVATVQGRDDRRAKWGRAARTSLRVAAWMSARVPHEVIVVSSQLAHDFDAQYGRATHHIPNGATPPDRSRPIDSDLLERLGLVGRDYLLNVGRLVPEKAMDQAIRAFRGVETDARLVVVGGSSRTSEYVDRLQALAADDDRVILTGPIYGDELHTLFSNASAYLMPSLLEGLPLALLEAAMYRLPLIVSDIPPHLEVVENDGPGHRVFRAGDLDDMAAAIQRTFEELRASEEECRKQEQRVAEEYSWKRITTLTEDVYRVARGRRLGSSDSPVSSSPPLR